MLTGQLPLSTVPTPMCSQMLSKRKPRRKDASRVLGRTVFRLGCRMEMSSSGPTKPQESNKACLKSITWASEPQPLHDACKIVPIQLALLKNLPKLPQIHSETECHATPLWENMHVWLLTHTWLRNAGHIGQSAGTTASTSSTNMDGSYQLVTSSIWTRPWQKHRSLLVATRTSRRKLK